MADVAAKIVERDEGARVVVGLPRVRKAAETAEGGGAGGAGLQALALEVLGRFLEVAGNLQVEIARRVSLADDRPQPCEEGAHRAHQLGSDP